MATLVPLQATRAGVSRALVAASVAGDTYDNTSSPYVEINNGSGASITVYAAIYVDGQTIIQGRSWAVGAGVGLKIAPMGSNYNDPATGRVSLTYSAITTVTIGVFY